MPRRLRYVPPGHPVEITQRTFQGRFLLKPSPEMNRVIQGVLGRAVRKYQMVLHAFSFLSHHYHLIVTPKDAHHLAAFLCYLNGNLAREVRHLCDWPQKIWGKRYSSIPITRQRKAQVKRLRYILAQGVKAGLVAKALDWPGASGLAQMLDPSKPIVGVWYDRTKAYRMRLAGLEVRKGDDEISGPPDGRFSTGDVATIDGEGLHRIVGRAATDLIKRGGYRIGAGEVEDVLLSHPSVSEAAVVGVADDDLGQRIVAFVVATDHDEAALISFVGNQLSWHKRPRTVVFVDALPRNAMGKVEKARLQRSTGPTMA